MASSPASTKVSKVLTLIWSGRLLNCRATSTFLDDVDGIDYWILAEVLGLAGEEESRNGDDGSRVRGYRPNVDLIYVPPHEDCIRHGSSLSAMVELAAEARYTLVETSLFNAFFVPT